VKDERGLEFNGRTVLTLCGFLFAALLALYFLLPQLAGLQDTWQRLKQGSPAFLMAALVLTFGMFVGYVALFRGVFEQGWRASYLITMAALAAARIFAAGGAGGLVLQAWALRHFGMARQTVADRTIAFLVLTYAPYAAAVVVCGAILADSEPLSVTVVPAVIALVAMGITVGMAFIPARFTAGVRVALRHLRSKDPALLGAVLFWAFQIAVLWASFRAFGEAPALAVLIQGFFVGMLGNLLPIPGGVGGVEGGMIGAYAAFGVDAGLAVVAVLAFRAFTFWLPLAPGVVAFFRLRRATIQSKA
jgi:uncharacterized membrane protein YbhN (UPF0104 family)